MAWKHSDDIPRSKETRERQIAHRKEVLDEARASGDQGYAKQAEERLNRGIDNYIKEHLN